MPGQTLLLIADISGFTRFVSTRDADEGVSMAREMLQIILKSNTLNLNVCEIEGDAVFLYTKNSRLNFASLVDQVTETFRNFQDYLHRNDLNDQLGIKFIVHAGQCPKIRLGGREKLFGQEVIMVHRLLKRKVDTMNYLLVTEAAAIFLQDVPGGIRGDVEFEHLGKVNYRLFGSAFLWSRANALPRELRSGLIPNGILRLFTILSGSMISSRNHA